jgi:hypothetical protein
MALDKRVPCLRTRVRQFLSMVPRTVFRSVVFLQRPAGFFSPLSCGGGDGRVGRCFRIVLWSRLCFVVCVRGLAISFDLEVAKQLCQCGFSRKYLTISNVHMFTCAAAVVKLCPGMDAKVLVSEQIRPMEAEYQASSSRYKSPSLYFFYCPSILLTLLLLNNVISRWKT